MLDGTLHALPIGMTAPPEDFCPSPAAAPPKHQNIHQRIGTQPIGSVHGDAGRLAGGVEPGHLAPLLVEQHLAVGVGGDAAHRVMRRRLNGNAFLQRLHAQIDARHLKHIGQRVFQMFGGHFFSARTTLVFVDGPGRRIDEDVVLALDAAPFAHFQMMYTNSSCERPKPNAPIDDTMFQSANCVE